MLFYVLYFVVLCIVCVDCVVLCIFLCKCVLYYCHQVSTQLQLTNISYSFSRLAFHIPTPLIRVATLDGFKLGSEPLDSDAPRPYRQALCAPYHIKVALQLY
jgi:hypothetical protein